MSAAIPGGSNIKTTHPIGSVQGGSAMSLATALCAYCEQLCENAPSHAVRVMRCPLCKTELGVTAGGAKFRLAEGPAADPQPHSHRHAILVSAIVAALLLGALIVALVMFLRARTPEMPPTPNVAAVIAPTLHSTESAVSEIAPDAVAATQATRQPEGAIAKPYSRPWRFRPDSKPSPYPSKQLAELRSRSANVPHDDLRGNTANPAVYQLELRRLLEQVPELALTKPFPNGIKRQDAQKRIEDTMKSIAKTNAESKESDGFVRQLIATRSDLAGLPFLLGNACRLEAGAAAQMSTASVQVRRVFAQEAERAKSYKMEPNPAAAFWTVWTSGLIRPRGNSNKDADRIDVAIATLTQILSSENAGIRMSLVDNLAHVEHQSATKALVKFSVFDLDYRTRQAAQEGLKKRNPNLYLTQLLQAFRYPWAPAARHAAETIAKLELKEAIPGLIEFLNEPDPAAPVVIERAGRKTMAVRELVRINHHQNCQLCHAPSANSQDSDIQVLGLVPNPALPLSPATSQVYYSGLGAGAAVVRADTTYLRQDFSVLLPVANPGPWPEQQRFDFLVRTRALDEAEQTLYEIIRKRSKGLSPQHEAALAALRELTGQDHGTTAEAWRRACLTVPGMLGTSKPGYTQ
jgi:hypothetical protein